MLSDNTRGALLMMGSMGAFTVNDALIKLAGQNLPLMQILFLRGILATLFILGLAIALRGLTFRLPRSEWGLIGLRAMAELGAAYFFLTALFNMPLANVSAILQVLPLTVTLGSLLVFREAVGWRRMLAIVVGFCGMLLIVRPGPDGFNIFAIYAMISVLFVTVRDLATRRLSRNTPSMTVTLVSAASIMLAAGVYCLFQPWQPVALVQGGLIVAAAVFILGGYVFSVMVMRVGEVGFVAPFRYTSLLFALVLGWAVFGDWPDSLTLLGAAIVVATGLFTLYREAAQARKMRRTVASSMAKASAKI